MSALLRVAEAVAGGVARSRQARAVHARGRTFHATVRTLAGGGYGVEPFQPDRDYPALVRLSRGAGLPGPWPDVLGVALFVQGCGPSGGGCDLLASSTLGSAPLARNLPFPKRRIATTYTTVSGYRTRRGRRYLAVLPDPASVDLGADLEKLDAAGASLLLAVSTRWRRWHVLGRIFLGEPLPSDVDRQLAFDPVLRPAPGLSPEGRLWRLRAVTYRASRRGRGAPVPADEEYALAVIAAG